MNNSPWRGVGVVEAGGMEDLQTDVMRFMAILAFCLLAVFALVQSMPMHAPPVALSTPSVATVARPAASGPRQVMPRQVESDPVEVPAVEPVTNTEPPVVRPVRAPDTEPVREWVPVAPPTTIEAPPPPEPQTRVEASVERPPRPSSSAPPRTGFSLRFSTDDALIRLVREGAVGLYALTDHRAWRMRARGDGLLFAPTSKPQSLRMMSAATIPEAVREALGLGIGVEARGAKIGVTLPDSVRAELDEILRRHQGGDIVIDESGRVSLEQSP